MKRFFSVQELRMAALPCGAFFSGEKIFSAQGKRAEGRCLKDGLNRSCGQGKRRLEAEAGFGVAAAAEGRFLTLAPAAYAEEN